MKIALILGRCRDNDLKSPKNNFWKQQYRKSNYFASTEKSFINSKFFP